MTLGVFPTHSVTWLSTDLCNSSGCHQVVIVDRQEKVPFFPLYEPLLLNLNKLVLSKERIFVKNQTKPKTQWLKCESFLNNLWPTRVNIMKQSFFTCQMVMHDVYGISICITSEWNICHFYVSVYLTCTVFFFKKRFLISDFSFGLCLCSGIVRNYYFFSLESV